MADESKVKVSAVLFDYGMVLSNVPEALDWRALERVLGADEKAFQAAYWKYRDAYDRGALSATAYWETVARDLEKTIDAEVLRRLINADTAVWTQPNVEMMEWAARLNRAGIKTGILSNIGDAMELGVLGRFPALAEFSHHTFSLRLGIAKPDAAIYRYAVEGLGVVDGLAAGDPDPKPVAADVVPVPPISRPRRAVAPRHDDQTGHHRARRARPDQFPARDRGTPRVGGTGNASGEQPGIEGGSAAGSGQEQGSPGEQKHDVGADEIGRRVVAHRQKQPEGDGHAAGRRHPRPQADQGADSDRQLPYCDQHPHRGGCVDQPAQQPVDRAGAGRPGQLGVDGGRAGAVEKGRIGQFLETGVDEGDPEKQTEGQQRPAGAHRAAHPGPFPG